MAVRVQVLASGSKGNCTWIASEKTQLLVDAGLSGLEISRRLEKAGGKPKNIDAIIVTHEHRDHVGSLGVLSRRYNLPIFITRDTLSSLPPRTTPLFETFLFQAGKSFRLGDLQIHPFSVPHDAADPVGFTIKNANSSIGICTDLGMSTKLVLNCLKNCNAVIIEANHDTDLLLNGPYPWYLKQRISSNHGHLSNSDSVALIKDIHSLELKYLILAHLSETNNNPEIVQQLFSNACHKNSWQNLRISISLQDRVGDTIVV